MSESKSRKPLSGGWIVLAIIVVAVIGVPMFITSVNDASARDVETQLLELDLPEGAELIDSMSKAAKLTGSGNGMQYLGVLLIESDQGAAELQTFYDSLDETPGPGITVAPADEPLEFHISDLIDGAGGPGTFYIYAWGEGPGTFFEQIDIRGR
ncbi:MAG: hypothetical protein ACTHXA_12345 [Gulosibacter sp.]|uniref:hypothetical protein n=1 Tax=Gulosibacter sp. TaxID=2817531 RepID=UPI003F93561F